MLYKTTPPAFAPKFEVSGLFLEHDGAILLLLRQDHKPQGNSWGLPAGKVDPGETAAKGLLREVREECGLALAEDGLNLIDTFYVRYPDYDFIYHMYRMALMEERPQITIDPKAHKEFRWVMPQDAFALNGIPGLNECITAAYGIQPI